jgi:ATP synthase F1 delta subunit
MKKLSKNARGFVDSVVKYIQSDGKSETTSRTVRNLLSRVSDDDKKQNIAYVFSAVALNKDEHDAITAFIEKLVGHPVTVDASVHTSLIGGIRIMVGDWVLDTSLKNQLQDLKSTLM